jgi:uncharacterized membrane protein YhdT
MTRIQRRTQVLLAVAALGAAGMFLGGVDWLGIDLGPIGATVLYVAMWLFVAHMAVYAGQAFPETWSPAEKQAWVGLVFVALVSFNVLNLLEALPDIGPAADQIYNQATKRLWINLGLLMVGWIVMASVLSSQDGDGVQQDERDLRIAHKAARAATGAMTLLIIAIVVALVVLPEQSRTWLRPLIAANVLIALLVARTLIENIYTVLCYRRERA